LLGQVWRHWQTLVNQGRQELGAKHLGQRLVVKQIAAPLALRRRASPQAVVGIQRASGHGNMHMGMEIEPTRVRMQYRAPHQGWPCNCLWFWLKVRSVAQAHSINLA